MRGSPGRAMKSGSRRRASRSAAETTRPIHSVMRVLRLLLIATFSIAPFALSGCGAFDTPSEYRARWDKRDEKYYDRMEKRSERGRRVDERYDAWWDSIMGR